MASNYTIQPLHEWGNTVERWKLYNLGPKYGRLAGTSTSTKSGPVIDIIYYTDEQHRGLVNTGKIPFYCGSREKCRVTHEHEYKDNIRNWRLKANEQTEIASKLAH